MCELGFFFADPQYWPVLGAFHPVITTVIIAVYQSGL